VRYGGGLSLPVKCDAMGNDCMHVHLQTARAQKVRPTCANRSIFLIVLYFGKIRKMTNFTISDANFIFIAVLKKKHHSFEHKRRFFQLHRHKIIDEPSVPV